MEKRKPKKKKGGKTMDKKKWSVIINAILTAICTIFSALTVSSCAGIM